MAYARISLTLPKAVLAAADRRAKELDRSRSWVIAEALREWTRGAPTGSPDVIQEASDPAYVAREFAEARHQRLVADLQLSPAERLRHAVDLARLARTRRPGGPRAQVIGFDSFEDFFLWRKGRRAGA